MMTRYSEEFREEAVGLVLWSQMTTAEVARDLGISVWTLRGWVQKHRDKQRADAPTRPETLEEEVRRLRRELAVLRQEREILKKAAAYFAKEQL